MVNFWGLEEKEPTNVNYGFPLQTRFQITKWMLQIIYFSLFLIITNSEH